MGEGSYFNLFFYLKMFNDLPSPAIPLFAKGGMGEGPGPASCQRRQGLRGFIVPLRKGD